MVLCGILASGAYACVAAKKIGYDYTELIIFMLLVSVGAVIGSHLLYALINYKNIVYVSGNIAKINSIKKILSVLDYILGGSVYYGGLIGGIVTGFILSKKTSRYNKFIDIVAVSIPLFHFFGRIGCFLGGCCYGIKSNIGFIYRKNPIIEANNVMRFPVQLLEASFNIVLFILLNYLLKRNKLKDKLLYLYLFLYSVARFFLEFLRGDEYRGRWFTVSTSQIISILIVLLLIIRLIRKKWTRHPCQGA
jgi:phosphatidylglycerol:prolipoprotein diacylglycerol transferase